MGLSRTVGTRIQPELEAWTPESFLDPGDRSFRDPPPAPSPSLGRVSPGSDPNITLLPWCLTEIGGRQLARVGQSSQEQGWGGSVRISTPNPRTALSAYKTQGVSFPDQLAKVSNKYVPRPLLGCLYQSYRIPGYKIPLV